MPGRYCEGRGSAEMAWTHRERLLAALNHEEADRVPMDFGSASPTAITMDAYQGLVDHLGVDSEVEYLSAMNQVVYPAEEVLRRFDIDTRGVIAGRYKGGHQKVVDEVTLIDEFGVTWKRPVGTATKHSLHVDGPFHDIAPDIDAIEGFAWPDPDNEGVVASKLGPLSAGNRATRIDMELAVEILSGVARNEVEHSEDAGGFVCECTYHAILSESLRRDSRGLFLHLPPLDVIPLTEQIEVVRSFLGQFVPALRYGCAEVDPG